MIKLKNVSKFYYSKGVIATGFTKVNLELDMGIGRFSITATILGNSDIDHGVGEAIINLLGDAVEYQINVSKGLGSVSVDGKNINNNSIIGNGMNKIDLDCGVGSVVVNFLR